VLDIIISRGYALLICALNGFVLYCFAELFSTCKTFLGELKTFALKKQAIFAYSKVKAQKCSLENT
jgi:hypothetical protein